MANPNSRPDLLRALLIVAAGLWVFAPVLGGYWLWDDDILITNNPVLKTHIGLEQIWFKAPDTDYWPLTWTLLWVEWHLWGDHTLGYHVVNLSLHLVSAFLIWRLFSRIGLRFAWIGGLLFAIHPLTVESVAWISEVKNTLSLPFFLLSLLAYIDEEERKDSGHILSFLYYLAAMLCKTSVVMLPVVLLLYCWWKRGRITWRDIRGTIPYFAIALVLGLLTVYFQSGHIVETETGQNEWLTRLSGAGTACAFYLGKFLLPLSLMPIYPPRQPASFWQIMPSLLVALSLVYFWTRRQSWGRHALLGFGFFLINLFPVLGIIRMAYMNASWVADHLVYLPMIGLIGLVVAILGQWDNWIAGPTRRVYVGIFALAMVLLIGKSHAYAGVFFDQELLWDYAVRHNPASFIAHNNLGNVLLSTGRVREAIGEYEITLHLNPYMIEVQNNLGRALEEVGQTSEAIEHYERALQINPRFALAQVNLANALYDAGRTQEAISHYEEALVIDPGNVEAQEKLAKLKAK